MTKLSQRQEAIINFIRLQVKEKGYPPSVREIGEAVGLKSSSTVHGHLSRLEKKGLIRRDPTKPRAIELLEHDPTSEYDVETVNVPLLGKVTAGQPITAIENIEDYYPLPKRMVGEENSSFLLRVQGDSMINAGIHDGDYVIVKKQRTANNGEIVVAMTEDDEATVKRFYKEQNRVRLQPENDMMEPIILSNVTILGKVTGLMRTIQ
ncbi:transcriptional repressor LexA [Novibacillus thermophilus]|jgi:repressor LexA|uniref:LexA repressor n=1 Tax=Novibacillus thermophilus TaxID=1471761 RepID=A0A1U9K9Q0_9BACL|nr:transcriptional repressor LexA [Novibacillus thermophilus]AQS56799.1 repressor LexA [Novibacillus thermophilus]